MKIQILTPEKTVFDGEAESIALPGVSGGFEVLKGHAPILAGPRGRVEPPRARARPRRRGAAW